MAIGCYTSKGAVYRSLKVALINGIRMNYQGHNTRTGRNTKDAKKLKKQYKNRKLKKTNTKREDVSQSELGTDDGKVSDNQHRQSIANIRHPTAMGASNNHR